MDTFGDLSHSQFADFSRSDLIDEILKERRERAGDQEALKAIKRIRATETQRKMDLAGQPRDTKDQEIAMLRSSLDYQKEVNKKMEEDRDQAMTDGAAAERKLKHMEEWAKRDVGDLDIINAEVAKAKVLWEKEVEGRIQAAEEELQKAVNAQEEIRRECEEKVRQQVEEEKGKMEERVTEQVERERKRLEEEFANRGTELTRRLVDLEFKDTTWTAEKVRMQRQMEEMNVLHQQLEDKLHEQTKTLHEVQADRHNQAIREREQDKEIESLQEVILKMRGDLESRQDVDAGPSSIVMETETPEDLHMDATSEEEDDVEDDDAEWDVTQNAPEVGKHKGFCLLCGNYRNTKMRKYCDKHTLCLSHDRYVSKVLKAIRYYERTKVWLGLPEIASLKSSKRLDQCLICKKEEIEEWIGSIRYYMADLKKEVCRVREDTTGSEDF